MISRRISISHLAFLPLLLLLAASCSNTKKLPKGESLYVGSKVNFLDDNVSGRPQSVLKTDLNGVVRPRPNTTLLGIRLKLTIYNLAADTSKKGAIARAIRKFGEPPVLASSMNLEKNEKLMVNLMQNRGFFYPDVKSDTVTKGRKTTAIFDVTTGPQYKIRDVYFPADSTRVGQDILETKSETLLKPELPYNLDLIKGERTRIDKILNSKGYYYFQPDYLIVKVDSTVGTHQVDMYVQPKYDEAPPEAFNIYKINDIYILPNYQLNARPQDTLLSSGTKYDNFTIIDKTKSFKPKVFSETMQFEPGETYNRVEQNRALSRLVSLGTFKFVQNRFKAFENPRPLLDVFYYLTPYPKKSIRFETGVKSQSDSRVGSSATLSWRNRNAFRGAELLTVTLRGGFEAQSGGTIQRPPTFEGGISVGLSVPRFLVPFVHIKPPSLFVPRTTIQASYDVTVRQSLYLIHSGKVSYGYQWKEEIRKEHQLFPININYVQTDTLGQSALQQNINFSNLVFNGLIIGPTYEYTFNGQATGLRKNNYYFNGLIDLSNNILGLAQGASETDPKKIFGVTYAQYLKFKADGRYYRNYSYNKTDIWANRLIIGYGIPYGNSRQLPNIKQFFSGGNSSLRGFRSRLVGPGTFDAQTQLANGQFIETLGDIKLEINSEIRKNIYQFLNVALFVDAGNIWTANKDSRFPGGEFTSDWYNQLAIDAGLGLRLDFNILLLRLDLGTPIRKPYLPAGQRLVLDQIDFGSSNWRRQNLILNLAIGYPF